MIYFHARLYNYKRLHVFVHAITKVNDFVTGPILYVLYCT
jgi:hypothetical protein